MGDVAGWRARHDLVQVEQSAGPDVGVIEVARSPVGVEPPRGFYEDVATREVLAKRREGLDVPLGDVEGQFLSLVADEVFNVFVDFVPPVRFRAFLSR